MNRRPAHLVFAGCLLAVLAAAPRAAGASSPGAHRAGEQITLLADGSKGPVTANLEEQITFVASVKGSLLKGQFIAIVTGKRLLASCTGSPCPGTDSRAKPGSAIYSAILYTRTKRLAPPAQITVTWRKLSLRLAVGSVEPGTLRQVASDPNQFSQLAGVPLTLSVTAPQGFATSWRSFEVVDLRSQVLAEPCAAAAGCGVKVRVAGEAGSFAVKALNRDGVALLWSDLVTIKPRDWQVALQIAGDGTTNPPSPTTTLDVGSQTEVDAVITEPNAKTLARYAVTEVLSRTGSANETIEQSCPGQYVCPVDERRSSQATVVFTARVLTTDDQSQHFESGRSSPRAISWYSSSPESFTLIPGLTTSDQHLTTGSFTGKGHFHISGVISWTGKNTVGADVTVCMDYMYYTTLQGLGQNCSGAWPDHQPLNANAAIEIGPPSCKEDTCGWNLGSYPNIHPFSPDHTYSNICIWGPCQEDPDGPYSPTGQLWFWAYPFGVQNGYHWNGHFDIIVNYS